MFAIPASITLARCEVHTSVLAALATVVWEVGSLLRPLLALPLAALALAALIEYVLPALIVIAAAD